MKQYMLLLYDDPSYWGSISPEEMQKAIQKYVAWAEKMRTENILVASHKLTDEPGKVVRGNRGGSAKVTDGPYSETKEVLGGYFLIQAADYQQALERSRECPHLEYGGTIEVREVDQLQP